MSELRLRRFRDIPDFLVKALEIRRVVLGSEGSHGISLRAAPLRRTFWTLSAWEDEASLRAFTFSPEHRKVMVRYRGKMDGSHFHDWTVTPGDEVPPDWADSLARLEATRGSEFPTSGR